MVGGPQAAGCGSQCSVVIRRHHVEFLEKEAFNWDTLTIMYNLCSLSLRREHGGSQADLRAERELFIWIIEERVTGPGLDF